ncbi:MAG: hypothetical protein ACKVKR_13305, partial [Pseudomonadales bacterium]
DTGYYDIELIVFNSFGCTDSVNQNTQVTLPPIAELQLSDTMACFPFEVVFTNLSDAFYADFEWNIGDSIVTVFQPDPMVFAEGDSIVNTEVVLTVSNICGVDIDEQQVNVLPEPQVSFVLINDTVCSPFTADILNTSVGLPDVFTWDFGNGQTDYGEAPDFPTYIVDSLAQLFIIELIGVNTCGSDTATGTIWVQPNTVQAFFAADVFDGCAPLEVNLTDLSVETTDVLFDFGNGDVDVGTTGSTIYETGGQYEIAQYVTGCSIDTAYMTINVWPEPEFDLSSSQEQYCEDDIVEFQLISDFLADVQWDFGQGDFDSGTVVTTVYPNDGVY